MDSGSEDHFGQYNLQPPQDFICTDMDPTKVWLQTQYHPNS